MTQTPAPVATAAHSSHVDADASANAARLLGLRPSTTPFIGRVHERETILAALAEVESTSSARVVSVLGPSGVGKTRLIYEALAKALARTDTWPLRVFFASARDSQAAYGIFARILRSRFGLSDHLDPNAARARVRAEVASVLEDRKVGDVLFFLGQLLELPFPESPLTKAIADDPEQGILLRRAVLKGFFEADAQAGALVLVFDDLHHATVDALRLLSFLISSVNAPILTVCSARGELLTHLDPFSSVPADRLRKVDLSPLAESEADALLKALLEPCGVAPPVLLDTASSLASGNPEWLERTVRIFREQGVLENAPAGVTPAWIFREDKLATVRVPVTIDDAVEARIASLSPVERKVLENAAVMGSVFWLAGLVALERTGAPVPELWVPGAAADEQSIAATLDALVERDYVLALPDSTFPGDREFVFKHNKERERIARLTNPADARKAHQVIADWLEQKMLVHASDEHLGALARHREAAGATLRAALSFLEAGDVARSQFAHQRAADAFRRGLDLLGDADAGRRIDALHNLGDVLVHLGRADEALAAFREMQSHAFRLDLAGKGGAAHNRMGRLFRETGSLEEASRHLRTALTLFEHHGDVRGIASSHDDIGKLHWLRGDYANALTELREGLAMRQQLADRRGIALSLNNLGLVLLDSGRFKDALEAFEEALSIRREIGDQLGVVSSLTNVGHVARDQRDFPRAIVLLEEALGAAKEVGDKSLVAHVLTQLGDARARAGQTAEAIRLLKQGEELCEELGDRLGLAEAIRALGKAYLLSGELIKARQHIARAVDLFSATRSKVHLGIALRVLAEVTAAGGWGPDHREKARDYFLRAVSVFTEIGNEVELARTFRAYWTSVGLVPELAANEVIRREAAEMDKRAEEIFQRLNMPKV